MDIPPPAGELFVRSPSPEEEMLGGTGGEPMPGSPVGVVRMNLLASAADLGNEGTAFKGDFHPICCH